MLHAGADLTSHKFYFLLGSGTFWAYFTNDRPGKAWSLSLFKGRGAFPLSIVLFGYDSLITERPKIPRMP